VHVHFADEAPPPIEKLAQRSARHDLTVFIDDVDLKMRMNAADRTDASLGRLIA
jgi:hypothetical protein